MFRQSEAFSSQIATEDHAETGRYWNAIVGIGGADAPAAGARKSRAFRRALRLAF